MEKITKGDTLFVVKTEPLEGNDVAPPLKLNEKHTAAEVYECSCGQQHIDVGLLSEYNYIRCYTCEKELPNGDAIHWCHPSRFSKG